jgi:hypothetical protein
MKDPNELTSAQQKTFTAFETTLKETFDSFWLAVKIEGAHLFTRNPNSDLNEVTTINDLAGKSTNFLYSLSGIADTVAETLPVLKVATLAEQTSGLFKSLPVVKTIADKITKAFEENTGIISPENRLNNFRNSFNDTDDAKQTIEKIAKTIGSIYADQFKKMNAEDAKVLAGYTNLMIITAMQRGYLVNCDDKVKFVVDWLFHLSMYHYDKKDKENSPKVSLQQENGEQTKLVMYDFYGGPGLKCLNGNEVVLFDRRLEDNLRTKSNDWGYRLASPQEVAEYEKFVISRVNSQSSDSRNDFIPVSPTLDKFSSDTKLSPILEKMEDNMTKLGQPATLDPQVRNDVMKIGATVERLNQETQKIQEKVAISNKTNIEFQSTTDERLCDITKREQELSKIIYNLECDVAEKGKTIAQQQDRISDLDRTLTRTDKKYDALECAHYILRKEHLDLEKKYSNLESQFNALKTILNQVLQSQQVINTVKPNNNDEQDKSVQNGEEITSVLQSQQVINTVKPNNNDEQDKSVQNKEKATPWALNTGTLGKNLLLNSLSKFLGKSAKENDKTNTVNESQTASEGKKVKK